MAKADNFYKLASSKQFGLALKRLLTCKDLSQRQFAKLAGLTPDYVSKLVNGEIKEPRKSTVEKIAVGLGITEAELRQQVKQADEATEPETEEPYLTDGSQVEDQEESATEPEEKHQSLKKSVLGLDVLRTVPVWVGRDELLWQLQTEFVEASNEHRPVVLALVGQGGIGKTSLAVKLLEAVGVNLQRAELASGSVYAGVICWRAEEGISFDEVTDFLLTALEIESAESVKEAGQKIQQIIKGLQQQRYLLLLDNLEVILHPASQPEAGRALQPEVGQLLNALVYRPHQSQVILTSREVPLDLADLRYSNSQPDPLLVRLERLGGVDVAAGAEILNQRQVKDSEADRLWVAERVEGHVFVLTQLAAVAQGRPGYLRQHPQLVTQRAEPILQEQLARQSEPARELLRRMCVLRVGIDLQGLTFLRLYQEETESEDSWLCAEAPEPDGFRFEMIVEQEELNELTKAATYETKALVEGLVESSLVERYYDQHKWEDVYRLHHLISEFLRTKYRTELSNLLKPAYLFYRTRMVVDNPRTLDDLRPTLEAQYFAFQLGYYSEASRLLMGILEGYLRLWGYWELLKDLYEQILPYIDEDNRAICLWQIGRTHQALGNWDKAETYFQEALSISRAQKDKPNLANSLGYLGNIECNRGNWDAAERLYRQSLQLREELGDRSGMASSWASLGSIERNRGNWDVAKQLYRQSLQLREELGDRSGMASSWGQLGDIERNRGNWDAAERLYRQCLQIEEELGDRSGMASSWGVLGDIERNRGNWDAAEQLYRQSLQLREELGDRSGMASSWASLGSIERNRGNWDVAEQLYRQSLQLREELGDRSGMASSWGQLGDIERNRGNWDAAERLYRQCLQIEEELGDRSGMASSWGVLGDIERNRGNWDAAEQLYQKSMQLSQELGSTWHLAHNNYDFAQLECQRGNSEKAQDYYNTAHQLFTQLGAVKDIERIEREWQGE